LKFLRAFVPAAFLQHHHVISVLAAVASVSASALALLAEASGRFLFPDNATNNQQFIIIFRISSMRPSGTRGHRFWGGRLRLSVWAGSNPLLAQYTATSPTSECVLRQQQNTSICDNCNKAAGLVFAFAPAEREFCVCCLWFIMSLFLQHPTTAHHKHNIQD